MKVTRAGVLFVLALAIASIAGTRARSPRFTAPEQHLTFAQLTDAHLFDEGWGEPPVAEAYSQADNWKALHWSIDRINTLVRGGKQIDFVVYTGDLGLQNVAFSDSKTCLVKPAHVQRELPPTPQEAATSKVIAELDRLTVRTIFFVSGNNDPLEEDASDGRFDCFLLSLQERAQALDRPLRVQKLGPDHCFALKGFHLLGLNSARFKNAANYQKVCVPRAQVGILQQLLDASCPESELGILMEQVASGAPTLLFTHVPDLKDPFRQQPAWDLDRRVRREWEVEARRPNVLGIFAGNFHDTSRSLYGSTAGVRALAVDSQVAGKTYLAPPLAIKDQLGRSAAARGFLLVTANRAGIGSTEVQWFGGAQ
ncbi:MAG: metallophosphoesterase family protein [Bryobacteraceae bacterium]